MRFGLIEVLSGILFCAGGLFAPNSIAAERLLRAVTLPEGVSRARNAVATLEIDTYESETGPDGKPNQRLLEQGACTGYLAGRQLLLTNHHCTEVKAGQEKRIRASFRIPGAEGRPYADRMASYLVSNTLYDNENEDITLVRLEEPVEIAGVEPIPIAAAQAFPKHPWKISSTFDMQYLKEKRAGFEPVIDLELCSVVENQKFDVKMTSCTSRPGNSGSPLLNNAGELVGILKAIAQRAAPLAVRGMEYMVTRVPFVYGTPISYLLAAIRAKPDLAADVLRDMRIEPINYKSRGHIEASWPGTGARKARK